MKHLTTILLTIILVLAQGLSHAQTTPPSPTDIQKVLGYYYNAKGQAPILAELKYCQDIFKEGDEKNNCDSEINSNDIQTGMDVNIWMNFLVPAETEANILMQLSHKGITRITQSTYIKTSIRYRTWKKVNFSKPGEWTLKIFYEHDDDVSELLSSTLNIKAAPEGEGGTAETSQR